MKHAKVENSILREGCCFLILYACAHVVSFPGQIIGLGTKLAHKRNPELTTRTAGTVTSDPIYSSGQGYEQHIVKTVHSGANL